MFMSLSNDFILKLYVLKLIIQEYYNIIGIVGFTVIEKKNIRTWTNKFLHIDNRASSKTRGAYAKLKKYSHVSTNYFPF